VQELFVEALDLEEADRAAFLDRRCGDDATLRAEVGALLATDAETASFLDAPMLSRATVPEQIGRYRICRVIASGGMGMVYEAQQDHPQRLVALKVLRRDAASPSALKRFKHETEILGRLKHPNIAQVYDAGTFDEGGGAQPCSERVNACSCLRGSATRSSTRTSGGSSTGTSSPTTFLSTMGASRRSSISG
jgi:serine/threonine protein kinase